MVIFHILLQRARQTACMWICTGQTHAVGGFTETDFKTAKQYFFVLRCWTMRHSILWYVWMKGLDLHVSERRGCCDAIAKTASQSPKYFPDVNYVFKNCEIRVDKFASPPGSLKTISHSSTKCSFILPKDTAALQCQDTSNLKLQGAKCLLRLS